MQPKITVSDFDKIRKLYVAAVEGGTLGHVVTTPALEGIRVTDLYVHPAARKLGVASSLIDEVKKRNKGNTLRLRARPYGVKGPDLTRLKEFYRKMGFVDDIAANDTMMQKIAHTKNAFGTAMLTSILGSRAIDAIASPLLRRTGLLKSLYSRIARAGIERGWRGRPSPLGVAAQSFAGMSPTLSGSVDWGFNTWLGQQMRNRYQKIFGRSTQNVDPFAFINYLKSGKTREMLLPLRQQIAKAQTPEVRDFAARQLLNVQRGLKNSRNLFLKTLPPEAKAMVTQRMKATSPLIRHTQAALKLPRTGGTLENVVGTLQSIPLLGRVFKSPTGRSVLLGSSISGAALEAAKGGVAGAIPNVLGGAVGGAVNTLPIATALGLGRSGKHALIANLKGRFFNEGLRQARHGAPRILPTLAGIVEPSAGETILAGRDVGRALSPIGLRASISNPLARKATAAALSKTRQGLQRRVNQTINVPLRSIIAKDMPRFNRLLRWIWPMGKQAALSRRALFGNLLKGFVKNEPPLVSMVPGVAAAAEAINKTAPKFTRRQFTAGAAAVAASSPDIAKYLAAPPLTLVRTLGKHPFLPARVIEGPGDISTRISEWFRNKLFPNVSSYEMKRPQGFNILDKIGSAELPYRDRSELIAKLKDKVLAMQFSHGGIGFYGGGIDPGEDPTDAATREFFEESGMKAKNVRPAGIPPVTLNWTPEMLEENPKLKERAKQFRGSRTHYFVGDIASRKRQHEKDLDTTTSTSSHPVWLTPEDAIARIEGYGGVDDTTKVLAQQRKDVNDARMQILRKIIADARAKQASADFAPGLPDRTRFGDVAKLPKEQALKFVIQEHLAQRSGRHYDVRMGTPDTGLYSWATKKEWPGPGGKIMLFQQPVHRYEYGDFQGRIPKGYGKGIVKTHDNGAVLVTHAADDKIKFIVSHRGTPEYYTLVRRSGPPENPKTERQRHSQGGQWLLINTTPTDVKKWIGLDPKDMAKLRYKSIPSQDVEKLFTQGNIIQNKIDGASMLYRLLDDHIEATSYRVSKEGRPIVHTQRLFGPGGMKVQIPKEHVGTVLRGEAYGVREGKAIPPQELGGILNASLINSLEKQRANKVQMKSMLFDVAGEQNKPYADRLAKLESITKLLPPEHFHLPESARTPEEAKALWETISSGKHPLTHEGVVSWPPQGVPTKAKLMPESDVWIRNVFPGEGKYKGTGAGGVEYSLSPEGEVVGRIGTGFSDEMRRDMIQNPERYIGRLARIGSQEQFPSGAHRAPAFLALHEDYPTKAASENLLTGANVLLESLSLANAVRERRKKLKAPRKKKASLIGEVKRRALAHGD